VAGGVHFMSVTCFTGEDPAPLRGVDVSSALVEILAITRWGDLDCLVIDMPPGLGDATLEAARLLPQAEYLVISTASRLVVDTVRRTLGLLRRMERQVLGVVENMAGPAAAGATGPVSALAAEWAAPYLGTLPRDSAVEESLGYPDRLLDTSYGKALGAVAQQYLLGRSTAS